MESVTYLNTHCCDRKKPLTLFEYAFFVFTCYRHVFLLPFSVLLFPSSLDQCCCCCWRCCCCCCYGVNPNKQFQIQRVVHCFRPMNILSLCSFPIVFHCLFVFFLLCTNLNVKWFSLCNFGNTVTHRVVAQTFVKLSTEKRESVKSVGPSNLFIDIQIIHALFKVLYKLYDLLS